MDNSSISRSHGPSQIPETPPDTPAPAPTLRHGAEASVHAAANDALNVGAEGEISRVTVGAPHPRADSVGLVRLTNGLTAMRNFAVGSVQGASNLIATGVGALARLVPPQLQTLSWHDVGVMLYLTKDRTPREVVPVPAEALTPAYVPEMKDKDFDPNTRYDFVRLGNQITEAGDAALNGVLIDATQVLRSHEGGPELELALRQLYHGASAELQETRRTLPLRPNICGLDPAETKFLDSPRAAEQLTRSLSEKITGGPEHSQIVNAAKHDLRAVEQHCEHASLAVLEELIEAVKTSNTLSPEQKFAISEELRVISKSVRLRVGQCREDILHNHAAWSTTESQKYKFKVNSRAGKEVEVESLFIAAGPAKSSSCARTQPSDKPIVVNFFRSMLNIPGKGRVLNATRSAVLVEFGVNDPEERMKTTVENKKKLLEVHGRDAFALEKNANKGLDYDHPLELDYQQVMLLTPDAIRHLSHKMGLFAPKDCYRADDERLLVNEGMRANQLLNGATLAVQLEDGSIRYVKFNIQSFNIPSNRLQEKLTYSFKGVARLFRRHQVTDDANAAAFASMTNKYNSALEANSAAVGAQMRTLPVDARAELIDLQRVKHGTRQLISEQYVLKNKPVPPDVLLEYTRAADALATRITALDGNESTKELAQLLRSGEEMRDLHADLNEMIQTKAYNHPQVLDGNRYAIGSRIIALGQRLEIATHFGCRSGKDRTGLQDDDVKQLEAEMAAEGRVPSYLEAEKWPSHLANTRRTLRESGNAIFNTLANVGIQAWGIGGGRRQGPKINDQDYYDVMGAAAAFSRPAANLPPGTKAYRRNEKIKNVMKHALLPGVQAIKHRREAIKKERVKEQKVADFRAVIAGRIEIMPPESGAAAAA